MKNLRSPRVLLASAVAAGLLVAACASTEEASQSSPGAAELWSMNCGRCHNFRSPTEFSDSEWDAITMHMRIRANLTAHDYREIRDFLKSSN